MYGEVYVRFNHFQFREKMAGSEEPFMSRPCAMRARILTPLQTDGRLVVVRTTFGSRRTARVRKNGPARRPKADPQTTDEELR